MVAGTFTVIVTMQYSYKDHLKLVSSVSSVSSFLRLCFNSPHFEASLETVYTTSRAIPGGHFLHPHSPREVEFENVPNGHGRNT